MTNVATSAAASNYLTSASPSTGPSATTALATYRNCYCYHYGYGYYYYYYYCSTATTATATTATTTGHYQI